MEWLLDPAAWVGLFTLIVLEIVLGIDNLVFIAILVDKLPPKERDHARVLGLSLALLMRLVMLTVMSWLVLLTDPLLHLGAFALSGRDLILIGGGFFLLFKGTFELHDRLEGRTQRATGSRLHASFWVIVTQIVVLDAVFSIDSVITAVGMVDHLAIMMAAVIVAMGIMLVASKPLTVFVNAHQTVVILCLGFLLTIGFSLIAEGFSFPVPKGYLYVAIAFSVLIETLNQWARRNVRRAEMRRPLRERTAEAVLLMLGRKPLAGLEPEGEKAAPPATAFGDEERNMVSGVLTLSDRNVHSVMTPRTDVSWINLESPTDELRAQIIREPHSFFPVCRGTLDEVVGIGRAKELLLDLIEYGHIRETRLREPIIVHETIQILPLMETLKRSHGLLVMVADEFGSIVGVVTPIDIFEAIAGEFPDEDEAPDIIDQGNGRWRVDGAADLHHLEQVLHTDGLVDDHEEYSTIAGYLLSRFGRLPAVGDSCELTHDYGGFRFTVAALKGRRIAAVQIEQISPADPEAELEQLA
ncbi:MAG: TerC family protein [Castellaniella sp.]|uniref:TerC family protein n=1 Tax=Castellaniella sp. TaxID=1955812 RepID=UPI001208CA32|nr:TerC family protein [Castellaniella sp.]TAN30167.1 MAG: TerC family protein [Castellaniella sp.]